MDFIVRNESFHRKIAVSTNVQIFSLIELIREIEDLEQPKQHNMCQLGTVNLIWSDIFAINSIYPQKSNSPLKIKAGSSETSTVTIGLKVDVL